VTHLEVIQQADRGAVALIRTSLVVGILGDTDPEAIKEIYNALLEWLGEEA
jgi:hypothetical protein